MAELDQACATHAMTSCRETCRVGEMQSALPSMSRRSTANMQASSTRRMIRLRYLLCCKRFAMLNVRTYKARKCFTLGVKIERIIIAKLIQT